VCAAEPFGAVENSPVPATGDHATLDSSHWSDSSE
jgi:hypothetical protein